MHLFLNFLCIYPEMMYFLFFLSLCCRMLEYSLNLQSVSFSAVRTVRVLRPLRAINRVPSEFKSAGLLHLGPRKQTLHLRTLCSFLSKHSVFLWRQITLGHLWRRARLLKIHILFSFLLSDVVSASLAWNPIVGVCDVKISYGWTALDNNLIFLTVWSLTHIYRETDECRAKVKYSKHWKVIQEIFSV